MGSRNKEIEGTIQIYFSINFEHSAVGSRRITIWCYRMEPAFAIPLANDMMSNE
jgi:hypothetical protein